MGCRNGSCAVRVAVFFVGRVVFMQVAVGVKFAYGGFEDRGGVVDHLHLFFCAAQGDSGGIRCIFGDEEVEDIDGLCGLSRDCWRRAWCLWRCINNCEGCS